MGRGTVRVGTSGWAYDDWAGRFYPEGVGRRRWFSHYAQHFGVVELNGTFYGLPRTSTVEKWHDEAPDRFRFAVKGSRWVTHQKKLRDPEQGVRNVVERLAPLKTFLGVWLWQLPPNLHRDVPRLRHFLEVLPRSVPHAVEFRHASWYDDEVEQALRDHGVAWVWLSDRTMPDATPVTADHVYVRFHGLSEDSDQRYRWDYRADELRPWATRLVQEAEGGRDAWVFFNNDHAAHAPHNAQTLVELLGDAALPWP